jgi:hypothetical protein
VAARAREYGVRAQRGGEAEGRAVSEEELRRVLAGVAAIVGGWRGTPIATEAMGTESLRRVMASILRRDFGKDAGTAPAGAAGE